MKKALARILITIMSIVTLIGIIPFSASAASTSSVKTSVFSFLTKEMKLNSAAACGIMANIERESDFDPMEVYYDSNGKLSGGLCQWNGGRFTNLKNFCKKYNLDWRSVTGQMKYLRAELNSSYYSHIYNYLKKVPNTKDGAYDAAWYWCYYFEIPANRSSKARERGRIAENSYWPTYGNKVIQVPTLSYVTKKTTYDLGESVKVTWKSNGKNVNRYKLYLVKQNPKTGKFEYNKANTAYVNSKTRSYTIKSKYLPIGKYQFYIYACNDATGTFEKSKALTFYVKCLTHENTSKVTNVPTRTTTGKINYKCKQCGYSTTQNLTFEKYFNDLKVTNVKVQKTTSNSATIKWDKLNYADEYLIFTKDGKTTNLTVVGSDVNSIEIKDLKPNQNYTFAVRARTKVNEKIVLTEKFITVKTKTLKATSS